jgi:hypothetical protein
MVRFVDPGGEVSVEILKQYRQRSDEKIARKLWENAGV